MTFKTLKKKFISIALSACVVVSLVGCGSGGEHIAKAMELIKSVDYQGALTELDSAEENGENIRLINRARGIACMGLVDYRAAIAYFEQAIGDSNGLLQDIDFDLNYYLAAAYSKNGQYSEAEEIYNAILALRQEEDAYFLRGNVRMVLGNYSDAMDDFDKSVEMSPSNYDRLIEIYEVLTYFGHEEVGKDYLRVALNNSGKQMDKFMTGKIYYYLGDYQNAYITLEEARAEGIPESYLYLGKAYEATGDYNYAVNVYTSYLNKYEGDAEAYNQLGLCEMTRGEYAKALEAFQAGIQLPENALLQTLSFNEIVAYEYLGEYEQACELLKTYLQKYPDDEQAKREYDFLSSR